MLQFIIQIFWRTFCWQGAFAIGISVLCSRIIFSLFSLFFFFAILSLEGNLSSSHSPSWPSGAIQVFVGTRFFGSNAPVMPAGLIHSFTVPKTIHKNIRERQIPRSEFGFKFFRTSSNCNPNVGTHLRDRFSSISLWFRGPQANFGFQSRHPLSAN